MQDKLTVWVLHQRIFSVVCVNTTFNRVLLNDPLTCLKYLDYNQIVSEIIFIEISKIISSFKNVCEIEQVIWLETKIERNI